MTPSSEGFCYWWNSKNGLCMSLYTYEVISSTQFLSNRRNAGYLDPSCALKKIIYAVIWSRQKKISRYRDQKLAINSSQNAKDRASRLLFFLQIW